MSLTSKSVEALHNKRNVSVSWRSYESIHTHETSFVLRLSLSLEGVYNVHGCHSLSTSMLRVGDTITNDILQKDLEDSTSFFVDQSTDTLHTTTTSQTADSWLGDTLDIVTKHLWSETRRGREQVG